MIKNRGQLEKRHSGKGASIALGALEAAVNGVEPGLLVRRAVAYDSAAATITVRDMRGSVERFCDFGDVHVVGAGKAAAAMAGALCAILRGRVAGGAINVPHGDSSSMKTDSDFCGKLP